VKEPVPRTDHPEPKRRAWALLIGLPLVAVVLGLVLGVLRSYTMGFVLVVFGLLVSGANYRRLKTMRKPSGDGR
jgi:hypothetical protein